MIAALAPVALSLVAPQPARVQPMQRAADVQMSVPKAAQVATLAAAAVLAGAQSASAGPFTRSDINSLTYDQIKGTGLANTCPVVEKGAGTSIKLAGGKTYKIDEFCLEPTSFQAGSFFRSLCVCVDTLLPKHVLGSAWDGVCMRVRGGTTPALSVRASSPHAKNDT